MSKGTDRRTVRVAPELWEAARAVADERGESLSDVIRWRLAEYIRDQPQITIDLARDRLQNGLIAGMGDDECPSLPSTSGTAERTTDRSTKRTGDGMS